VGSLLYLFSSFGTMVITDNFVIEGERRPVADLLLWLDRAGGSPRTGIESCAPVPPEHTPTAICSFMLIA